MPEKFTLLELHVHSDGNEFRNDVQFSSDLGSFLKKRFGGSLLGDDTAESDEEDDLGLDDAGTGESEENGLSLDLENEEGDEDEEGADLDRPTEDPAVVEIDTEHDAEPETADLDEEEADDAEEEGGRSIGLFAVLLVISIVAVLAWQYLSGGEDFADEFDDDFEDL